MVKICSVELCNRNCLSEYCYICNSYLKKNRMVLNHIFIVEKDVEMNIWFEVNVDITLPILDHGKERIER